MLFPNDYETNKKLFLCMRWSFKCFNKNSKVVISVYGSSFYIWEYEIIVICGIQAIVWYVEILHPNVALPTSLVPSVAD